MAVMCFKTAVCSQCHVCCFVNLLSFRYLAGVVFDLKEMIFKINPVWGSEGLLHASRASQVKSKTMTERTLILIKPDGVANGHVGEIIARIERKGLKLVAMDLRVADKETAEKHYAEHADKPFFGELVQFITSAPLVAGIVEGPRAIEAWRQLAGGTDPVSKATPGTIRGDFALTVGENVVHGSDSPESAEREIGIWFPNL